MRKLVLSMAFLGSAWWVLDVAKRLPETGYELLHTRDNNTKKGILLLWLVTAVLFFFSPALARKING